MNSRMYQTIDLHVHSTFSDGTLTPAGLVRLAKEQGLSAFALTDHDTTAGLPEALAAAGPGSPEIVPGIEFSSDYLDTDVHIVGLDVDWCCPDFQAKVEEFRRKRNSRNQRMIDRMAADGIDISVEKLSEEYGCQIVTRAHMASYLLKLGVVRDRAEAFRLYIGEGCRYYVPKEKPGAGEIVRLIRRYGGIPVLAHPLQYHFEERVLKTLIAELKDCGLIGMEVYYSVYSDESQQYLLHLAAEYGLLPGGGSDFHGMNKPDIQLGTGRRNLSIPYSVLENLRNANTGGDTRL